MHSVQFRWSSSSLVFRIGSLCANTGRGTNRTSLKRRGAGPTVAATISLQILLSQVGQTMDDLRRLGASIAN